MPPPFADPLRATWAWVKVLRPQGPCDDGAAAAPPWSQALGHSAYKPRLRLRARPVSRRCPTSPACSAWVCRAPGTPSWASAETPRQRCTALPAFPAHRPC